MKPIQPALIAILLSPLPALATTTVYLNETSYLNALNSAGYGVIHEGFDNDAVWAPSRSTIVSPASVASITNQGILWDSNYASNNISTSTLGGAPHDGLWGALSNPHFDPNVNTSIAACDPQNGSLPAASCYTHDGFAGVSNGAGTLYGAGGWIDATFGSNITVLLDGVEYDFGAGGNTAGNWRFFGAIDTNGFNRFEFRDNEGTSLDAKLVFVDDFSIGVDAATVVPLPSSLFLFGSGLLAMVRLSRKPQASQKTVC